MNADRIVTQLLEDDFDAKEDLMAVPPPSDVEYWEIYVGDEDYLENENTDGYSVFFKTGGISGIRPGSRVDLESTLGDQIIQLAVDNEGFDPMDADDIQYIVRLSPREFIDAVPDRLAGRGWNEG